MNKTMSFSILRCKKCGRVFFYPYCAPNKRVECPNMKVCRNKVWVEKENMIDIKFGTDFVPLSNVAYLYISVFNNYAYLAARVFSEDSGNFMVLPVSERNVSQNLSRRDTITAIPAEHKHATSWDGTLIKSGCYPVSPEMEAEIRKNIYVRESEPENVFIKEEKT